MKVTAQAYGQFLVNTPLNVTGTYFADTASGFAHDCQAPIKLNT